MVERDEPLDLPETRRLSRRSFVKGCIYASAAGAAVIGTAAVVNPLSLTSKAPFKRVDFVSATRVSGPAPQGVPLMPLSLAANGDLQVNPTPKGMKGSVLDWYKYCSHEKTVGLQSSFRAQDETIRYFLTEEKRATIVEGWYLDKIGNPINIADFDAVGKGAGFNWRSQGQAGKNIISGIVIRINPDDLDFSKAQAMEAMVREGFIAQRGDITLMAFSSFCKHFCCVPGWHESALAQSQGFWDKMFCTCHFSVYDPYQIKSDFYMLQVEEGAEAAAHA